MRRFIPRRFRHLENEPPFDNTHQHKIPGPWPIVALAIVVLMVIGLVALVFGQQARLAEHDRQMTDYLNGRGVFRDAEAEATRELLCAVMPQLQADDAGILERYARDLRCPKGPATDDTGDETAALPTPIDGAQPNSTGRPSSDTQSDRETASGGTAPRTGTPAASPSPPGRAAPSPQAGGSAHTASPPQSGPSETPPEREDSGGVSLEVDPGLKFCLPLLGCVG